MDSEAQKLPLVSVVIPTYNRGGLVPDTIRSVLNQTHGNWECIVVDDGSTDKTANVVASMIDEIGPQRLRYIHQENAGVAAARNHGAREARGEYVLFLDSDDLLFDHCLSECLEAFGAAQDADLVYCGAEIFEEGSPERVIGTVHHDPDDLLLLQLRQSTIAVGGILWRAGTLDRTGPFDERLKGTEDWEHLVRALAAGAKSVRSPCVGSRVRVHAAERLTDVSEAWGEMLVFTMFIVLEELAAEGKDGPPYTDALSRFLLRVCRNLNSAGLTDLARKCYGRIGEMKPGFRSLMIARGYWSLKSVIGVGATEALIRAIHRLLSMLGLVTTVSPWLRSRRADS